MACAVLIAFVLIGDVAAAVVVSRRSPVHTPRELERVMPALRSFVEQYRGLSFKRDVTVSVLDDEAFDRAVSGPGRSQLDPMSELQESQFLVGFLKAMGLVGPDFTLSMLDAPGARSLLGIYQPTTKRILVRSGLPQPMLRRVVVHELTHALDDQYFPLEGVVIDLRTEQARALQALLEGDAVRVDNLYRDQLPPAERAAGVGAVEASGLPASTGPFLDLLAFPYVMGGDFVRALAAHGGTAAIDDAFRMRPTTSEEILHPDRYLQRTTSPFVPTPPSDGPLLGLGVLGEIGLRLVLGETLDVTAATRAADGWGGDHYVAWSAGSRTCVRVSVHMDSPTDTNEVRDALRVWATKHPGTEIKPEGEITTVTRCA